MDIGFGRQFVLLSPVLGAEFLTDTPFISRSISFYITVSTPVIGHFS